MVKNGRYLFITCISDFSWNDTWLFRHYFHTGKTSNFVSTQFEKEKRNEVTKTSQQSGLEPETVRTRTFGLFTWAIWDYELTNAGGKIRRNHFGGRHRPPVPALRLQAFATHRHKAFVSRAFRVERQRWASPSSWDKTLPRARNTGLLFPSGSKIPDSCFPRARKYRLD